MIEELEPYLVRDEYRNIYGNSAPSIIELMDKINEIIRWINQFEQEQSRTQPLG